MSDQPKRQCQQRLRGSGTYGSFNKVQCMKRASDGSDYCTVHNPQRVQAKREANTAKWSAASAAKSAEAAVRVEALNLVLEEARFTHTETCESGEGSDHCQCILAKAMRKCKEVGLTSPYSVRQY